MYNCIECNYKCIMNQSIQVRVNPELKKQADIVFADIGLDAPTAIRLFLTKVVSSRSIPFELKSNVTDNGFSSEFEDQVLEAEVGDQIGPFKTAKTAIKGLNKRSK